MRDRSLALALAVALTVLVPSGRASAHVTIDPAVAPAGAEVQLTFVVPNERSDADTTQLDVQFPADTPIASVKVRPIPGWTFRLRMRRLATPLATDDGSVSEVVDTISWSGGRIRPNEYQTFAVLAGPLPARPGVVTFKAVQRYSNGEVVRWIERRTPGAPEPPNPAPMLRLR